MAEFGVEFLIVRHRSEDSSEVTDSPLLIPFYRILENDYDSVENFVGADQFRVPTADTLLYRAKDPNSARRLTAPDPRL